MESAPHPTPRASGRASQSTSQGVSHPFTLSLSHLRHAMCLLEHLDGHQGPIRLHVASKVYGGVPSTGQPRACLIALQCSSRGAVGMHVLSNNVTSMQQRSVQCRRRRQRRLCAPPCRLQTSGGRRAAGPLSTLSCKTILQCVMPVRWLAAVQGPQQARCHNTARQARVLPLSLR